LRDFSGLKKSDKLLFLNDFVRGGVGSALLTRLSHEFPVMQGISKEFLHFFADSEQYRPPPSADFRGFGAVGDANSLDSEQGIAGSRTGNSN
jgi:hypothetical protein